jgi:hypothetical protein
VIGTEVRGALAGGPTSTTLHAGPRGSAARRGVIVSAVVATLVLGVVVVSAFAGRSSGSDPLDIGSARPDGTRALAEILRDRGVAVTASEVLPARPLPGEPRRTLVVLQPGRLDRDTLTGLLSQVWQGFDVVLVGAGDAVLGALDVGVDTADDPSPPAGGGPHCALPEATVAGSTTLGGGLSYTRVPLDRPRDMTVTLCYGDPPSAARLAVLTPDVAAVPGGGQSGRLVLLGSGGFLTNDELGQGGDAALALGLLARHSRLSWITPVAGSADSVGRQGLLTLLPPGVRLACVQVLVLLVLLALWRGRRLGPPVAEPLPVVVRAAETVEGRGRLYAAAQARDHAADTLRAGARVRLAERGGLPVRSGPAGSAGGPDPVALVASVAERTGRSPSEIGSLLYGSGMPPQSHPGPGPAGRAADRLRTRDLPPGPAWPPAPTGRRGRRGGRPGKQDAELIALAQALDDLDRQVGGR